MKKTLFLVCFLFLFCTVNSAVFSALISVNEFGQPVDYQSEYQAEILPDRTLIYKDDAVERIITGRTEGKLYIRTEEYPESGKKISYTYENSLLKQVKTEYPDSSTEILSLVYSDSSLVFSSFRDREGNTQIEYYLRNAHDNSLMAVRRYESVNFISPKFMFKDESLYANINGIISSGKPDVSEEGNVSFTRDGTLFTYNSNSLLIREENSESSVYYTYNANNELIKKTVTGKRTNEKTGAEESNGTVTEIFYDGLKKISEVTKINNIVSESIEYPENDGMIKTVYSNGVPYAKMYYRTDNKRVLKVEYLNKSV